MVQVSIASDLRPVGGDQIIRPPELLEVTRRSSLDGTEILTIVVPHDLEVAGAAIVGNSVWVVEDTPSP